MSQLSEQQRERYQRQLILPEIGEEGQLRLAAGKVLIVGAGGLGSPAAFYLAAAGVGTIGIVDDGEIELSNLQRQILHNTSRIGMPKVESAKLTLNALNPEVNIIPYHTRLTACNAPGIIENYDLVVSALDNTDTRYIVNEACVALRKPLVEGGVRGFGGMLMTILPGEGPCYSCVFPRPSRNGEHLSAARSPIPMFGTSPGVIGVLQAHEALKLLLKTGTPLVGKILFYDGITSSFCEQEVRREPHCSCCGSLP
ncbi:MAG TPA: HesA/MoeB/ThiF family protein [Syntrophomonadaceae bacterium]|nr:HesA/MoeB/ThiF family protein [Syntrophomonadaceae bacterium]